ncbi:protein NSP-INTERACTING KINASE 2 isoform X1 [Brassica napus]|uniref:protein NSP-INTERACTING KINASE 2 isoform X1 n=1 Tax=Brassica napus TaxID=3708 RepID=UPI000BBE5B43|nr:protein NSP-INTERACTING KINASE 2 isoform X1 [Brassica napus]
MVNRRRDVKKSYALFSSTFFCIFFLFFPPAELSDGVKYEGNIPWQKNFEVLALIEIKSSLIDPRGVLVNWDNAAVDPCSWDLITCSPDGFVLSIGASDQSLSGTLASSIGNLTYLQTVLLQNNNIRGNIPPEIGRLMKLKTLNLSNNNFTGQIPPTLSHSTSFQYLRLNHNSLTGTVPTSVANMAQLILLDLSYNNLSGPVPRLHAIAYNVIGNPQTCSTGTEEDCNGTHHKPTSLTFTSSESSDGGTNNQKFAVQFGLSLACICLLIIVFGFY